VEGGNVNNDWWDFGPASRLWPRVSPLWTQPTIFRYREDFALLKSLGHNAHLPSLERSRIELAPGAQAGDE
jgi:beta-glucosidase